MEIKSARFFRFHKRKNYLLLELLIALFLVAICALPLMRSPLDFLRAEISSLENMELQRIAELSFAQVYKDLYQETPWEQLISDKKSSHFPYKKDQVTLDENGVLNRTFNREYYIWTDKEKENDQEVFRLLEIKIVFSSTRRASLEERERKISFSRKLFFKHPLLENNKKKNLKTPSI